MLVNNNSTLIAPCGGRLIDLTVPDEAFDGLKAYASQLPSIQISPWSVCDLELLASGAFSPLDHFMGREDYQRVLEEMRLVQGHIFPIPLTLPAEASPDLHLDRDIALRNSEYELLGVLTIEEIYPWDRIEFADKVFGTQDLRHPMVAELHRWGSVNISGRLQIMHLPGHYDFQSLRLTPSQTRARLADMGVQNVVGYQPQYSMPLVDEGLPENAVEDVDGILLLQLAVGMARLGDVDHYTRVRIYKALVERCSNPDRVLLSLIPLANRMAGFRETLWQALIFRNYGANHMIVRHNLASPMSFSKDKSYFKPQDALEQSNKYCQELGVKMLPEQEHDRELSSVPKRMPVTPILNPPVITEFPNNGQIQPGEMHHPEVAEILAETYPPRHQQGVCIWFTGLSGAGKTTTAEMLTWLLMEHGRRVTVLDGDVVRTHLSKGLGFSKEDRDTNVRRIGFVASELVRIGGVVICSVVSPYRVARNDVRNMVGVDHFVEVFVNTSLEVCEARDVKGMYARARRGELLGFTGIDDPYEPPDHPEITLDTVKNKPNENANIIIKYLIEQDFIRTSKPKQH